MSKSFSAPLRRALLAIFLAATVAACSTPIEQIAAAPGGETPHGWVDSALIPDSTDAGNTLISNGDGGN
jgi:hypothetical protein